MRFVASVADNSPDSCSQTGIFDGLQQEWPTMLRKNRAPRQVLVDFYSLFHLFNR